MNYDLGRTFPVAGMALQRTSASKPTAEPLAIGRASAAGRQARVRAGIARTQIHVRFGRRSRTGSPHLCLEEAIGSAAFVLRPIERRVRMVQQQDIRIRQRRRENGDADAARNWRIIPASAGQCCFPAFRASIMISATGRPAAGFCKPGTEIWQTHRRSVGRPSGRYRACWRSARRRIEASCRPPHDQTGR